MNIWTLRIMDDKRKEEIETENERVEKAENECIHFMCL